MDTFAALADPTRRRVVEMLAGGAMDAGTIASHFDVSRPAVSRHLRVLREAGIVECSREAQRNVYVLRPQPLEDIEAWAARYRSFWSERLDRLDETLGKERCS